LYAEPPAARAGAPRARGSCYHRDASKPESRHRPNKRSRSTSSWSSSPSTYSATGCAIRSTRSSASS